MVGEILLRKNTEDFFGYNTLFFIGVVEDNQDPLAAGRIRVRPFGWYTQDKEKVPTEALPWATIVTPTNSSGVSGIGFQSAIQPGAWVFGLFLDGADAQKPMILGTIPGVAGAGAASSPSIEGGGVTPCRVPGASSQPDVRLPSENTNSVVTDESFLHPDLQRVLNRAREIAPGSFRVVETKRSYARQTDLVAQGASRTYNSRHLTGHAVDIIALDEDGRGTYEDLSLYDNVADAFKQAAAEENVQIVWGGDWSSFVDRPHFELSRSAYPADSTTPGGPENTGIVSADCEVNNPTTSRDSPVDADAAQVLPSSGNLPLPPFTGIEEQILTPIASAVRGVMPGFVDPDGIHPIYNEEPDTSRLARREGLTDTYIQTRINTAEVERSIPTARTSRGWSVPQPAYGGRYPYNNLWHTASGHTIEMDDSPGQERINIHHRSGSYIEIDANGTTVTNTQGDNYQIVARNDHVVVRGDANITIFGNNNIYVINDANIDVDGDANLTVRNDFNIDVSGDTNFNVLGKFKLRANDIKVESFSNSIMMFANTDIRSYSGANTEFWSDNVLNTFSQANTTFFVNQSLKALSAGDLSIHSLADGYFSADASLNMYSGGPILNTSTSKYSISAGALVGIDGEATYIQSGVADSTQAGPQAEQGLKADVTGLEDPWARETPTTPSIPYLARTNYSDEVFQRDDDVPVEGGTTGQVQEQIVGQGTANPTRLNAQPILNVPNSTRPAFGDRYNGTTRSGTQYVYNNSQDIVTVTLPDGTQRVGNPSTIGLTPLEFTHWVEDQEGMLNPDGTPIASRAIRPTPPSNPGAAAPAGATQVSFTPQSSDSTQGTGDRAPRSAADQTLINRGSYPGTLILSDNFVLSQLSSAAVVSSYRVRPQHGLSVAEIVQNLKGCAQNIAEPVLAQYPDMIITSGFRHGNGRSQHERGQAIDMQFISTPPSGYYDIARWIKDNLLFDQMLLEYKNTGSRLPWIHVSFKFNGNRNTFSTFFNHRTYASNQLVQLA